MASVIVQPSTTCIYGTPQDNAHGRNYNDPSTVVLIIVVGLKFLIFPATGNQFIWMHAYLRIFYLQNFFVRLTYPKRYLIT